VQNIPIIAEADKCIPQHSREPRVMLAYGTKALVLAEGEVGVLVHVHLKHNHENKRLFRFLYNSYVSEYEFFLLFLRKQSSYLRLISSGTFLERIHFSMKMEHFGVMYPGFFRKTIWFFMDPMFDIKERQFLHQKELFF
jgi:hypothetical protein